MVKWLVKLVTASLLWSWCTLLMSSDEQIVLVFDQTMSTTEQFLSILEEQTVGVQVESVALDNYQVNEERLHIALGHKVMKRLLEKTTHAPILTVFISELSYKENLEKYSLRENLSAIYSDPGVNYQMRLAEALYQRKVRVGVLLSDESIYMKEHIERASAVNELTVIIDTVSEQNQIAKTLSRMQSMDVLLALPDHNIYNSGTIRSVLLSTYRNNQAIIGFSVGMVKAGALATVYSNVDNIAEETVSWIQEYKNRQYVLPPRHATRFDVKINEHVARSLDISYLERKKIVADLHKGNNIPKPQVRR